MDELHNHIHSAVIDLEREHVESYLCVSVYIYEFIFHSSMDQNTVDFVLLIFYMEYVT